MKFERIITRTLSDGRRVRLFPFHLSFEGLEKAILCRDNEDYDVAVKYLALAAHRAGIIIVTYVVVSNHLHCVVLSRDMDSVLSFTGDYKKRYAMWLRRKYSESKVLQSCNVDIQYLDSDRYLRNAVAYDIRNALDNGAKNIANYKWSSFRAYFCSGKASVETVSTATLSFREREITMHCAGRSVFNEWLLNGNGEIEPVSFCDWEYVEAAFAHDQAFFLRTIGAVNTSEMQEALVLSHRLKQTDMELYKTANEKARAWYNQNISELSLGQKAKMIPYIIHSNRTTVPQLARCFGLSREYISRLLHIPEKRPAGE